MNLTYTQCKQLAAKGDLLGQVRALQDQPLWITEEQPLELSDIHAIQQGGCESGAYMPAVTYNTARDVMHKYGGEIVEYIQDAIGELPAPNESTTWGHICTQYYSLAVELWCSQFELDGVNWD